MATEEPADYKRSIGIAVAEFERGNYSEAREQFARAHALFPNARTLRGLGMIEFELRHYVDAVVYLEDALASDVKRLEGQLRQDTAQLLASAKVYVGNVRFQIAPPSAELSVDGFPVQLPDHATLRLEVGDHVLEFRAEGRLSERRAITLRGEQTLDLQVTLAEPELPSTSATTRLQSSSGADAGEREPLYKKWWLWTSVGVVVVGGAVATALLAHKTEHKEQPVITSNTPTGATLRPLLWGR